MSSRRAEGSHRRIVVKLSGSLFTPQPDAETLKPYITFLKDLRVESIQPIIVTGGGLVARQYVLTARELGADEASLDDIGIMVTRLNAALLLAGLGEEAYPTIPLTLGETVHAAAAGRIVVTGGLHPGHSTNATAALIAERIRADLFINSTDVEGVYSSDPRRDSSARKLDTVDVKTLRRILSGKTMAAGSYELMDLVALKIIERSKIPTRVVKCTVEALKRAVRGEAVGTLIICEG